MEKSTKAALGRYDSLGVPIFRHDHHKALWGYLADHPGADKIEAMEALGLEHFSYPNKCPACGAKKALLDADPVVFRSMYGDGFDDEDGRCMGSFLGLGLGTQSNLICIKCCPLDWSDYKVCTAPHSSLFDDWAEMQSIYEAHTVEWSRSYTHRKILAALEEYATIIRDLPLNESIRNYYHIVE